MNDDPTPDPLREAKPSRPRGATPLIVGLIIAICLGGFGVIALRALSILPTFTKARNAAARSLTITHVKQIQSSLIMYTIDHDDLLPLDMSNSQSVRRALDPNNKLKHDVWRFENPAASEFSWNSALAAKNLVAIPNQENTALVFDSAPWGRSRSEAEEGYVVGFLDGRAHMRSQQDFDRGRAARWVFPPRRVSASTPR